MDDEHDRRKKEKVRKCGSSAKGKAVKLGRDGNVFSVHIHYNPTHHILDGAIHLPVGQSLPDLNKFVSSPLRSVLKIAKVA